MIQRYSRAAMREIWTEQRKLEIWLQIELLASEALCAQGLVPEKDFAQMKAKAAFSVERCKELEKTLNHDVVAFTTNVAENIGAPASRWLHFGLTSSDVVDTAFAVQMVQSAEILIGDLKALGEVIGAKARQYQFTPMIGRSHGIHAEPTTFGLKMALMFDEFARGLQRLQAARQSVAVGKLSGAVGTSAHLSPKVETYVCKELGLRPAPIATQVIQRDLHAEFIGALALVGASIERWATEFRHLQRTEVLELEEFFAEGQKGSSAMPHKRNPITSERLSGLARVIRGNAIVALENVALWHERDISHSSAERIILPDSCILLDYMLATLRNIVEKLQVYPERMAQNLAVTKGLYFSQSILLALTRAGMERKTAYEAVQRAAMRTWKDEGTFADNAKAEPEIAARLSSEEINRLCSLDAHFKYVDATFRALGL